MSFHFRSISILSLMLLLTSSLLAEEQKLAGIAIGDSDVKLQHWLGNPDGIMIPLQPLEILSNVPEQIASPEILQTPADNGIPTPPNTLSFTDNTTDPVTEVEIGESTIISTGSSTTSTPINTEGTDVTAPSPGANGDDRNLVTLPPWAYCVRVDAMTLDQKEYIYRVNATYSIGVVLTRASASDPYLVSDVAICSFDPLKPQANKVNWKSSRGEDCKGPFMAKSSLGVTLGDNFNAVLKRYNWTEHCFPFVSDNISDIQVDGSAKKLPLKSYTVSASETALSVTPEPNLWEEVSPVPGDHPIRFTNGKKELINAGFSRSCLLIYPGQKIAFTLVDFKVVRIHIGAGVVPPPPTPQPPQAIAPDMPAPSDGGGGGAPPAAGGGVAPPTDEWWK